MMTLFWFQNNANPCNHFVGLCDCTTTTSALPLLPIPLHGFFAAASDQHLFVGGGTDPNEDHDSTEIFIWQFNGTASFDHFPFSLREPRKHACVTVTKNKLVVRGGINIEDPHHPCLMSSEEFDLNDLFKKPTYVKHKDDPSLCTIGYFLCYFSVNNPNVVDIPCFWTTCFHFIRTCNLYNLLYYLLTHKTFTFTLSSFPTCQKLLISHLASIYSIYWMCTEKN